MRQFEYRVIDTGRDIEKQLNDLGAQGWQVVGVTPEGEPNSPLPRIIGSACWLRFPRYTADFTGQC